MRACVWHVRLGLLFGVDGLVEVDPEDAGKKGDRRCERQEQHDCPDGILRDPPAGDGPQQCGDERYDHKSQPVADIHGAEKITRFALEPEIADGTTVVHLGESSEDGSAKNVSRATAGTALAKNVSYRGEFCGGCHRYSLPSAETSKLTDRGSAALGTVPVDAHADFVLICDYTGKEVVE